MNKLIKAARLTAACVTCTMLINSTAYADEILLDCSNQICSNDLIIDNTDEILIGGSNSGEDLLIGSPVEEEILLNPVVRIPEDEIIIKEPVTRTPVVSNPVTTTPVVTTPVVTTPVTNPSTPAVTPVSNTGKSLPNVTITADMKRAVELINQQRAKVGASKLVMSNTLNSVANIRANEASQRYSHIRPNGKQCISIYSEYGINYNCAGENLAVSQKTAEQAVSAWMLSTAHRNCMLNSDYTQVGISSVTVNGHTYWALCLIG